MSEENSDIPFDMDSDGIPLDIVSEEDREDLIKWMLGMTTDPPAAVQKIAANLANKINMMMGYIITMNLSRVDQLSKFMKETEDYLFDAEELINMDDREQMLEYYKTAGKQMKDSLEWTRKYVYQNKKDLKEAGQHVDKAKSLLMSMSKDQLDAVIGMLEKGNIDKMIEENTNSDPDPDMEDPDVD